MCSVEEGGRGGSEVREVRVVGEGVAGSLESRLFLLGRMVVWTMLRNLPTVWSSMQYNNIPILL